MKKRRRGKLRRRGDLFGESSRSLSATIAVAPQGCSIDPVRLEHLARRIHVLGPRVLFELLAEHNAKGGDLVARCERYSALDPDALAATGGDRFPPRIFEAKREDK